MPVPDVSAPVPPYGVGVAGVVMGIGVRRMLRTVAGLVRTSPRWRRKAEITRQKRPRRARWPKLEERRVSWRPPSDERRSAPRDRPLLPCQIDRRRQFARSDASHEFVRSRIASVVSAKNGYLTVKIKFNISYSGPRILCRPPHASSQGRSAASWLGGQFWQRRARAHSNARFRRRARVSRARHRTANSPALPASAGP